MGRHDWRPIIQLQSIHSDQDILKSSDAQSTAVGVGIVPVK